ncbi:MAG: glucose-6-phosphate isomerase, partial [Kangiellaceae bacterium]
MSITNSQEWKSLQSHLELEIANKSIADLFANKERFNELCLNFDQLTIDFSKQKLTRATLLKLVDLAKKSELEISIKHLVTGELVNTTESRAALHTALRGSLGSTSNNEMVSGDIKVQAAVKEQLDKMSELVNKLRDGQWRGYSGKAITDVVNIGVGGSDLGPLLVCDALDEFRVKSKNPIHVHFASTMDGSQVSHLFDKLNPETTLFIIVSKSFGTIDTLAN